MKRKWISIGYCYNNEVIDHISGCIDKIEIINKYITDEQMITREVLLINEIWYNEILHLQVW